MLPVRLSGWMMRSSGINLLLVGCILTTMTGCAVALLGVGAGAGAAGATYVMGKLEDEVDAPVPKVQRATVAALKSLELPVDKERGDKLVAELESETADQKKVWVSINSLTSSRSKLTIRVGLLGDEVRSRQILQAIRARL
ncbi:MAG: DUF3568 domain-containing protein [Nitrospirota bacterium]|nr:DUF3568 domain-containing protein [Nitrospirota bacterium]MDH5701004.1 DUF3568 domain-containing protein [Nitrospirota bacterium]